MAEEQVIHLETFEYFLVIGGKPTQANYQKVADEFDLSLTTINRWSKKFKWASQARERKVKFKARLEQHSEKTFLTVTDRYRDIIRRAVDEFDENLKAGLVRLKKTDQFISLVKLDLLLTGQTIGNNPVTINIITGIPRPGDRKPVPDELPITPLAIEAYTPLLPGVPVDKTSPNPEKVSTNPTMPEGKLGKEFLKNEFQLHPEADRPNPEPNPDNRPDRAV